MSDTGDDLVTLTVKTTKPNVERWPDVNVPIGDRLWRVHEPKVISWMAIIKAARSGDMASLALDADDFLRDCMPEQQWDELRRYVKQTNGLDQQDLIGAAQAVAMHYAPHLDEVAHALGMAIADDEDDEADEDDEQIEPAPRPRSAVKKTTKKPAAKKTAKRG